MQTQTETTARTKPAKRVGGRFTKQPTEAWQFTTADLDYLRRLTARMVAIGAWERTERVTMDTVNGEAIEADYWYLSVWSGDDDARPAIERHDGMYFLTAGDGTELARGKTIASVTKRFARALSA